MGLDEMSPADAPVRGNGFVRGVGPVEKDPDLPIEEKREKTRGSMREYAAESQKITHPSVAGLRPLQSR